jgi:hypothetical protein
MASQHQHPSRAFRPDPAEYDPAKATVQAAGHEISHALRAALRWIRDDPQAALAVLTPYMQAVAADSPRGRPPSK